MRATLNLPPSVVLIEAALEGLVQVNRALIETGKVPPSPLDTRVRYKRESSGLEEWDNAYTCLKRGWGDCEDLNAWECARINIEEDEWAMCALIQTGPKLLHCVVEMSDGSYRDVCPELGMKVPGTALAGIPWMETRAENIIGSRFNNKSPSAKANQHYWRQNNPNKGYRPKSSRGGKAWSPANAYVPKASERSKTPYEPKSSRPSPVEPKTPTPDPIDAVSPTSVSQPQNTQAMPMQSYPSEVFQDVESLVTEPMMDPEAFDEDLETDEDEDEELAS